MVGLLIFEGNTWNKLRFSEDLHRRERMFSIFLLILAINVISLPGVDTETHLDCTNDYDEQMFCEFKAQNCSEYNVTVFTEGKKMSCIPEECNSQCCCSSKMVLVPGRSHTVEVWRGEQKVESKIIDVVRSIKPKVPTIISVDKVNGNFQVKWKTNMQSFLESRLTAEVMYRKKGDTINVTKSFKPQTIDNLNIYEISGEDLKPSTTYVVTVRSYTNLSGKFSDSSKEVEFSTRVDTVTHLDCTNDYDEQMFCEFKAQNCSEYNVTVFTEGKKMSCIPEECNSQCCCSSKMVLVPGRSHTVEVWRGEQKVESKIIDVVRSIKPKVPTIISVDKVNGNFQVKWKTNMQSFLESRLTAEVMYRKKGDTINVTKSFKPQTIDNLNIYEISGEDLKPSTTYVVTVRSYTNLSGKFSDSSKEVEFSTRVDTVTHLDCTNDYDEQMFCEFKAQNCSEYNVTVFTEGKKNEVCIPEECNSQCCCSCKMVLVPGRSHTVEVWRGEQKVESKIIDVVRSIKPKVPTIISVDKVNGNFQVKWKTNMDYFLESRLTAEVMYRKKGDTINVTKSFKPQIINNLNIYEISGEDLKPSTTYVVTVRSYTNLSGKFSDSSKEVEFSTPASHYALLLALILSLSTAAVLIATAAFYCFVKVRRTWDNCPNPKIPILRPFAEELLKPQPPFTSSVSIIEPLIQDDSKSWSKGSLTDFSSGNFQQSSGIGSGSSCLSYANAEAPDIMACRLDALSKVLPGISPVSPLTSNPLNKSNQAAGLFSAPYTACAVKAVEVNSGSSGFDNKSYSILIPNPPHQIMTESSEVQTQAEMVCDSAYCPVEDKMVTCPDQRAPACPLLNVSLSGSPPMATEMSYQQCNVDSGRLSYGEDSSLFSISSDTDTTASCDPAPRAEAGYESVDEGARRMTQQNQERKLVIIRDDNTSFVPAGSQSCPQVDDAYQSFQTLVGQPVGE